MKILQDHPKQRYKHNYSRHQFINDLQLSVNEVETPYNLYPFYHSWVSGLAFYSVPHSVAAGGGSYSWVHRAEVRAFDLDGPECESCLCFSITI